MTDLLTVLAACVLKVAVGIILAVGTVPSLATLR